MAAESEEMVTAPVAPPKRRVRSLVEWTLVILGAVVVALLIKTFVVQAFYIPTGSMEPTLIGELHTDGSRSVGDRILVNKLSYRLHGVNRGDVVVFDNPDAAGQDTVTAADGTPPVAELVKRVIGLPGDVVVLSGGHVSINGAPLAEPYLPAGTLTEPASGSTAWEHRCTAVDPCVVPTGSVWVMGDNRSHSRDSRYIGPIPEDTIIGRAFVIVWPAGRAGGL
jgi:signal peptidase I